MRLILVFLVGFTLSGCATGDGYRWVGSESRLLQIDGVEYSVQWVRAGGGYDMRSIRSDVIVLMPDPLVERRRNTEAALTVARSLCPTAAVADQQMQGAMFLTVIRC